MPLLSLRLRFVVGVLFVLVAFAAPLSAGPIPLDFEDLRTESTLESVVGLTYSYEGFTLTGGAFNLRSIDLIETPSLNSDLTPVDLGPASLWPKP